LELDAKIRILYKLDGSVKRILLIKQEDNWCEVADLNSLPIEVVREDLENITENI
jgi:hypothetical protein